MKRVTILGVTGSIGQQGLEVIDHNSDSFLLHGISAHKNVDSLIKIALKYHPKYAVIADETLFEKLREALSGTETIPMAGYAAMAEIAADSATDIVLTGLVGSVGLLPLNSAICAGKIVALANKEPIVMAGDIIMKNAREHNAKIIPVDSEPSAIYQALQGENKSKISKIILTASGGALKNLNFDELKNVTPERALKHPTWEMGKKITIDCATLINKGLEVIEAHHLFAVPYEKIEVLVHPESVVHSMVEFTDGVIMAQLGSPTMKTPIQYALYEGKRDGVNLGGLNLAEISNLTFMTPDFGRFPALKLAINAGREGKNMAITLNAANSVAVEAFLGGKIAFTDIPKIIEWALENIEIEECNTIDEVLLSDKNTTTILNGRI